VGKLKEFWIGRADLAPVALFRIVYGIELFNWFWQLLPNIPAFPIAYLALQKIGAISVAVNTMLTSDELHHVLNDSGAQTVFTTSALLPQLQPLLGIDARQECVVLCEGSAPGHPELEGLTSDASGAFNARAMSRDAPAAILYTSGTTGKQKGAVLSHGNVVSNMYATGHALRVDPTDRLLLFLPLFHCFGQNFIMNTALNSGATIVLHRRFVPEEILTSITKNGVSMFFGTPTVYIALLNAGIEPQQLAGVRYYFSAAAPMPVEVATRWRETFGRPIHEGYGLTETSSTISLLGPDDQIRKLERVVENGDASVMGSPWVVVQGKGGNRDTLWQQGDTYQNIGDGIFINISKKFDSDNYEVTVRYSDGSRQPDVGLYSWLSPPGNTYETTDIWVDSPVNGYGTFRYGTWSDLHGGTVPQGNGDDPAIGQVNRLYARVRNFGTLPATNVVVHFDITNPPGVGINGSNGFVQLGTVTSAQFPGLASINSGASTDVYLEWTPNFTITPAQLAAGRFAFHTCVRVRIDHLPGEKVCGNQDGDRQQENIDYFHDTGGPG